MSILLHSLQRTQVTRHVGDPFISTTVSEKSSHQHIQNWSPFFSNPSHVTCFFAVRLKAKKGISCEIPEDGQSGIGSTPLGSLNQIRKKEQNQKVLELMSRNPGSLQKSSQNGEANLVCLFVGHIPSKNGQSMSNWHPFVWIYRVSRCFFLVCRCFFNFGSMFHLSVYGCLWGRWTPFN